MKHRVDDLRNMINLLEGPLEEEFAKIIFYDLVSAVSYCHSKNIVHRDIKMENILLDYNKKTNQVHIELTDFGLACH